jgi:hypothetical protein
LKTGQVIRFVQDQRQENHCQFLSLGGVWIFNLAKIDQNVHDSTTFENDTHHAHQFTQGDIPKIIAK